MRLREVLEGQVEVPTQGGLPYPWGALGVSAHLEEPKQEVRPCSLVVLQYPYQEDPRKREGEACLGILWLVAWGVLEVLVLAASLEAGAWGASLGVLVVEEASLLEGVQEEGACIHQSFQGVEVQALEDQGQEAEIKEVRQQTAGEDDPPVREGSVLPEVSLQRSHVSPPCCPS